MPLCPPAVESGDCGVADEPCPYRNDVLDTTSTQALRTREYRFIVLTLKIVKVKIF
jgi:hypothetical protein